MDDRDRILQRSIDGELGVAQNAALQHLVAQDRDVGAALDRLERLDHALRRHAIAGTHVAAADDALVAAIVARMPAGAPLRQQQLRLLDIAVAAIAAMVVVLFYGLVGTMRDLLPLTAVAVGSLVAGILLVVMARPLRQVETGVLGHLLRKRLNIGSGDLLVYRVTGIAIVIGGLWLLHEIG